MMLSKRWLEANWKRLPERNAAGKRVLADPYSYSLAASLTDVGDGIQWELRRCITNAGLDLSLGCEQKAFDLTSSKYIDFERGGNGKRHRLVVPAGHTVSVQTRESLLMGRGIGGMVASTMRMVRQGLSHVSTTLDPDWDGPLMITFTNTTTQPVAIDAGQYIVTAVLFRTDEPVVDAGNADPQHNASFWREYTLQAEQQHRKARISNVVIGIATLATAAVLAVGVYFLFQSGIEQIIVDLAGRKDALAVTASIATILGSFYPLLRLYLLLNRWWGGAKVVSGNARA